MPAAAPPPVAGAEKAFATLGQGIRARRKALSVTATTAAQAAGLSRVTWHRIEQGEPSVTMGAYVNAMLALGLLPAVQEATPASPARQHNAERAPSDETAPTTVMLSHYPELRRLAWQLPETFELTAAEALGLYERHWRHLDPARLDPTEQALLDRLRRTVGKGHLLV